MEEADFLYNDLYEDVGGGKQLLKTSLQEIEERLETFKKQEAELQERVEALQKENEALQQGKAVLIRNISCLFKGEQTAQMELARKDKQIKELRDENMRLKMKDAPTDPSPSHNKRAEYLATTASVGQDIRPTLERSSKCWTQACLSRSHQALDRETDSRNGGMGDPRQGLGHDRRPHEIETFRCRQDENHRHFDDSKRQRSLSSDGIYSFEGVRHTRPEEGRGSGSKGTWQARRRNSESNDEFPRDRDRVKVSRQKR